MILLKSSDEVTHYMSLKPVKKWRHTKFQFICAKCGQLAIRRLDSIDARFLCKTCAAKQRYVEHPEIIEKIKQTHINRYGGNGFASDTTFEKYKLTMHDRYDCEFPLQADEFRSKYKDTMLKRYGATTPLANCTLKEKARNTCISHNDGVGFASNKIREKYNETCMRLYGGVDPSKTYEANKRNRRKYTYNSCIFDSSWELAYYIWLTDNHMDFEYHPNKYFEYKTIDGKVHKYEPDFYVSGSYIEIKGKHLINDSDELIDPFNKNCVLKEKTECLKRNKIIILKNCDFFY